MDRADQPTGQRTKSAKVKASLAAERAPLGGTNAQALHRLQIGLVGISAMLLLVGLASIIGGQAQLAQDAAVPDAAPTTEPTEAASQSDPLADAGVVPDISASPAPQAPVQPQPLQSPSPPPLQLPAPGEQIPSSQATPDQSAGPKGDDRLDQAAP